jgi:hypothetical protein
MPDLQGRIDAKGRAVVARGAFAGCKAVALADSLREPSAMFKVSVELPHSVAPGIMRKIVPVGGTASGDGRLTDIFRSVHGAVKAVIGGPTAQHIGI